VERKKNQTKTEKKKREYSVPHPITRSTSAVTNIYEKPT
jgi:hypothetical protein